MASSFLLKSDQSIDLPDKVPSSKIGAASQFHEEQCQQFAFFCPIQTTLQIILFDLRIVSDTTHNFSIFNLVDPASSHILVSQSSALVT